MGNRYLLATALALVAVRSSMCAAASPQVTVVAVDAQGSEVGPKSLTFLFTRDGGAVEKPLTVNFSLAGSATAGADYRNPGTSVTFPAYSPLASLKITPIADGIAENTETVVLTLIAREGYGLGDDKSATGTITDSSSAAKPAPDVSMPQLPPPDRTGSLVVSIAFDGTGHWKHPKNGAYSDMTFHRELSYTVPLRGTYGAGSGFIELDRQAQRPAIPNFKRYLVGQPRDQMARAGTPCGRGSTTVLDESKGMEVGDPGQPPLVPFTQAIKGGGPYPSGDRTVPERDLCMTMLSVDNERHVLHLRLDGTDAHVKVLNTHNGHTAPAYNLRLQGEGADTKEKFTFFDLSIPAGAIGAEGVKTIPAAGTVSGPMNTKYPLEATVKWRISWQ